MHSSQAEIHSSQFHAQEVSRGERFRFGDNWTAFLATLNEHQISGAETTLKSMINLPSLKGLSFLDIGSGSGLSSLVAMRLGAEKVYSFDYDPQSVACTKELRDRYFRGDARWHVEQGSALDPNYLASLGGFDVVYSWGVLHHTGKMWEAIANATSLVKNKGILFLAIYNDQGATSQRWKAVKKFYNRAPSPLKTILNWAFVVRLWGPTFIKDLLRGQPNATWKNYSRHRGMLPYRDVVDWIGGYPFEVAKPEKVFDFCRARGFQLSALKTCGGGLGCNEFVFTRLNEPQA